MFDFQQEIVGAENKVCQSNLVRLIHACGMTDIVEDIFYSPDVASSAKEALKRGAPILCDARMVAEGIISSLLPANNEVLCWNKHPECIQLANKMGTTLSAAAGM